MGSNVRKFNMDLDRLGDVLVPEQLQLFHQLLSLAAVESIVMLTPVDTGRARGNWSFTRNNPSRDVDLDKEYPGETRDARGAAAVRDVMAKSRAEIDRIEPFSVAYFVNNLPYIEALEDGHSQQARSMVKATVNMLRANYG